MTPADAASRAALFTDLEQRSQPILDGPAEWRRFTPGRIEIFGKHTDYAGGHSLVAAVPRGITLAARRRSDGIVRVGDIFDGQVIEVDPSTRGAGPLSRPPALRARRRPPLFPEFSGLRAWREHRDCQRPAARVWLEQLERAGRGRGAGADRTRRTARSRRVASALAPRARPGVVPRLRRERTELPGPARLGRRRHARRQRGSHRDPVACQTGSCQPVSFRSGAAAGRHADAARTGRS